MNKYVIHGQRFTGNVTLEYDDRDRLRSILFECEMDDTQHAAFIKGVPLFEHDFIAIANRVGMKYSVIPADLSFNAFWVKYNYKVGNKPRAEKVWNALSESEKICAFKSIAQYNSFLATKRLDKAYAETWLYQKRFLTNEY